MIRTGRVLDLSAEDRAWRGLLSVVRLPDLPGSPPPLRTYGGDAQLEELLLEGAFRARPADAWARASPDHSD
jgi:hypothetical protein